MRDRPDLELVAVDDASRLVGLQYSVRDTVVLQHHGDFAHLLDVLSGLGSKPEDDAFVLLRVIGKLDVGT